MKTGSPPSPTAPVKSPDCYPGLATFLFVCLLSSPGVFGVYISILCLRILTSMTSPKEYGAHSPGLSDQMDNGHRLCHLAIDFLVSEPVRPFCNRFPGLMEVCQGAERSSP